VHAGHYNFQQLGYKSSFVKGEAGSLFKLLHTISIIPKIWQDVQYGTKKLQVRTGKHSSTKYNSQKKMEE